MEARGVVDAIDNSCLPLVEWADGTHQSSAQLGVSGPGSEASHVECAAQLVEAPLGMFGYLGNEGVGCGDKGTESPSDNIARPNKLTKHRPNTETHDTVQSLTHILQPVGEDLLTRGHHKKEPPANPTHQRYLNKKIDAYDEMAIVGEVFEPGNSRIFNLNSRSAPRNLEGTKENQIRKQFESGDLQHFRVAINALRMVRATEAPVLSLNIEVSREGGEATYVEIPLVHGFECPELPFSPTFTRVSTDKCRTTRQRGFSIVHFDGLAICQFTPPSTVIDIEWSP
ncbi:hypothetical protein Cgig2_007184 [Carnegiea gigantea]|uniref:Uncharacterized protein n=1 Tax=Carnegiea gigantea TaxID=171969 RepID=A0A9Q1KDE3_9CARY|nr:hypothetical protein Cgig2_007184 [Carnegiea gigantea]